VDSFQVDTILFLVNGIAMIAITLGFGFALTVEQIRTSAKKPQAARQRTSDRLTENEGG
jgi:hypothetical protein